VEEGAPVEAPAEEAPAEEAPAEEAPQRARQRCDLEDARELVNAARKRLERTGLFEAVVVRCKEVEGGLAVTFKANAAQIIRQIEYVNTSPLLESEVAKRLQLRRGQAMPTNQKDLEERLDSIRDLYRQAEGLYDTQVTLRRSPVPGSNLLDLEVVIERGRELKVNRVVIGGHTVFRYNRLRSLLLEPIGWFGAYRDAAFKEGIELILQEYRKEGYFQARVVDKAVITDVAAGTVELRLELSEGAAWDVEFVGNRDLSASELRQKTTFLNSGYVDRVEIERSAQELEALYETTGYFFARVEPRESRDATGRNRLTFQIAEGARGEIRSIRFEGASALSESELLDQIQTSTYGLLSGGTLQRKELQADLGQIVAAYQARGYLQAQAPSWRLEVSPEGDAYDLTIQVREGPQTRLAQIALEGNLGLSDEAILETLESRDGEVLSLERLTNDQGRILQFYRAKGWPLANVKAMCSDDQRRWGPCEAPSLSAECFPEDPEDLCEGDFAARQLTCRRVRQSPDCRPAGGLKGERAWVRFQVTEGERLKVGEIFLRGNFRTRPHVILDSLSFQSGDDFSPVALYESQSELRRIGLFEAVSIETIGLSEDDVIAQITRQNRVVIVIQVEELPARFLDVRFGFETRNLLQDNASLIGRTEAALVENNLLGYGMGVQLKLQAALDLLQIIDLADPTSVLNTLECVQCLDWFLAAEALYFDPRSIFWRAEWTVSAFYSLDLIGVETFSLEKEEFGARTSVRKQLQERLVGQLSLEQSWTSTRNREEDPRNAAGERLFSPQRVLTKPALKLTYDKRNSPLNPTRGYYLEFTPELAFDFLFDSGTNYFKVSGGGSQFWTWFRSLTLAYGLRFGYAAPLLGAQAVPEDELFRLGGTGSLRGFGLNSVGPLSSNLFQARGGEFLLRAHGELRFPLFRELDIYGVYFLDGGFLVDCRAEVSPLNPLGASERVGCLTDLFTTGKSSRNEYLRGSSGLGVRWLLLGQIPVVLDYGLILDRQLGEPFGDLQFNVGYNF
jgi:outer membrane protein insertion porin family